jgi:hypothetical protein
MKKPSRKLTLFRETLHSMEASELSGAQGGGTIQPQPIDTLARPSRPCPVPTSALVL